MNVSEKMFVVFLKFVRFVDVVRPKVFLKKTLYDYVSEVYSGADKMELRDLTKILGREVD